MPLRATLIFWSVLPVAALRSEVASDSRKFTQTSEVSEQSTTNHTVDVGRSSVKYTPDEFWPLAMVAFNQNPRPKLGRGELSDLVRWLMAFAGTDTVQDAVVSYFTTLGAPYRQVGKMRTRTQWQVLHTSARPPITGTETNRIPTLAAHGGGAVHWVYYKPYQSGANAARKCSDARSPSAPCVTYNSYRLGHQKAGSHQFCQSFALIYMICDNRQSWSELSMQEWAGHYCGLLGAWEGPVTWVSLGHYIQLVTSFWKMVLKWVNDAAGSEIDPKAEIRWWFAERFRAINQEAVAHNSQWTRSTSQHATMWPSNEQPNDVQVFQKVDMMMKIIDHYADQIAESV